MCRPPVPSCASDPVFLLTTDASVRTIYSNLPFNQLHAPVVGPAHPFQRDNVAQGLKNHRAGFVEVSAWQMWECVGSQRHCSQVSHSPRPATLAQDAHLASFHFDDQYNTFHTYGYAQAPEGSGIVAHGDDAAKLAAQGGNSVWATSAAAKRQKVEPGSKISPAQPDQPWTLNVRQPWADKEAKAASQLTEEQVSRALDGQQGAGWAPRLI